MTMDYHEPPETREAAKRVRLWAFARYRAPEAPIEPGTPTTLQPALDARLIGLVPARKKIARHPCPCGGKFYARGMCRVCFHRKYDRLRREERCAPSGAPKSGAGRPRVDRTGKGLVSLTPKMQKLAELAAKGLTAREIAGQMDYTVGTVRVTLQREIYPALGVKNLAGLVELLNGGSHA